MGLGIRTTNERAPRLLALLIVISVLIGTIAPTGGVIAQTKEPRPEIEATKPAATAEPTAEPPATGIDGNTYISPTFGYTLSWDERVWTVEDEMLLEGYDGLRLGTEVSIFYLEGYFGFEGDGLQCLADAVNEIAQRDSVAHLEPIRRPLPVPPADAGEAALYLYTLTLEDATTLEVIEYVECRTLSEGEAVLEITFQTAEATYDAELPAFKELMANLDESGRTPVAATLPGRVVPVMGADHVGQDEPHEPYNSTPPTSGPHWGEWADWGVYDEPIPDEMQVHNLEHGGVMLQYSCACPEVVALLERFADPDTGYPVLVITAPYPDMDADVALTAWGRILELDEDEVTADVVRDFVEAFIDQGPERIHTAELAAWRDSDAPKP